MDQGQPWSIVVCRQLHGLQNRTERECDHVTERPRNHAKPRTLRVHKSIPALGGYPQTKKKRTKTGSLFSLCIELTQK